MSLASALPVAMIVPALVVAAATLAVGLALALALRALPTVRLQLVGLAALAVCLPLAAVLLSGWVMFHMGDDVKILAVSSASAAVAVVAGLYLAHSIARSVERVRAASVALAGGDLSARAPETGPTEVADLAVAFNEMAANLEQLFDARRELVAWASHDLRTPLANMQALLEALEDGLVRPEDYLPALREQVRALAGLVDDLFELARIDAGALTLELHVSPLAGVIQSCLRGVEAEARLRGIGLESTVDDSVTARFAPETVERVLLNLLTNALRHTPTDGAVAVRVRPLPHEVEVTVEDNGEGLDEEARQRMFERFWRSDRARSSRGAGLGLAIARGLVEAHGGRIWAEERPGGGARVSFTLPAA
jgi:signal transduction histidine kinase